MLTASLRFLQKRSPGWDNARRVVYACLKDDLAGLEAASRPFQRSGDWSRVSEVATRWQVTPLVYRSLRAGLVGAPEEMVAGAQGAYRRVAAHAVNLDASLEKALAGLRERRIPVLLLKGAALSRVPAWRVEGRPMADIDVLVHKERLADAIEVLEALGYARMEIPGDSREQWLPGMLSHQLLPRAAPGGSAPLEVHWSLVAEPHPFTLAPETLWEATKPLGPDGGAFVLAPEAQLAHIALHASWNHGYRQSMAWLSDVWKLTTASDPAVEWAKFARLVWRWQVRSAVYWPLWVARSELGAPVPQEALAQIQPGVLRRWMGRALLRWLGVLHGGQRVPGRSYVARALNRQLLIDRNLGPVARWRLLVGALLPGFVPANTRQGRWRGLARGLRRHLAPAEIRRAFGELLSSLRGLIS